MKATLIKEPEGDTTQFLVNIFNDCTNIQISRMTLIHEYDVGTPKHSSI